VRSGAAALVNFSSSDGLPGSVPYGVVIDLTLIRSLLFVPGDSAKKLDKAKGVIADALIFDWEDAVLFEHKQKARDTTIEALRNRDEYSQPIVIRINPVGDDSFVGDCEALKECRADAVMLPKCISADDIALLENRLAPDVAVIPIIETPLSVLNAASIAACSDRVGAFMFGAEDYSVAMGIERSADELEVLYARSATVTAARAYGIEAIDSPAMDYRDLDALRKSSDRSRRLGFSGRSAIHPNQVPVINEAFTPSAEQATKAAKLLEEFEQADSGAIGIDGRLIDEPILRQARRVVARFGRLSG
jgi:citrate lyase subunit beta/citryl-CoA lyase